MKKSVKITLGILGAAAVSATVYLIGFVCGWGSAKDDSFDASKDEDLGTMDFDEDDVGPAVGCDEGLFDDDAEVDGENDEVDSSMFVGTEGEE